MLKFSGPHYFQTLWCIWFMFCMMIDSVPKFYAIPSPPLYMTLRSRSRTYNFYVKVLRFKFLQCQLLCNLWWIWFMFCMVIDTGPKLVFLRCQFLQRIWWIWFMVIETCPKFYVVPSPPKWPLGQGHRLRIFMLDFYSVSFCKAFDGFYSYLAWIDIRFYNASERKSTISGELSCLATGLIIIGMNFDFCGFYRCVNSGESLTNWLKHEGLYVKFVSDLPEFTYR